MNKHQEHFGNQDGYQVIQNINGNINFLIPVADGSTNMFNWELEPNKVKRLVSILQSIIVENTNNKKSYRTLETLK
jgi:hypothetical protein